MQNNGKNTEKDIWTDAKTNAEIPAAKIHTNFPSISEGTAKFKRKNNFEKYGFIIL